MVNGRWLASLGLAIALLVATGCNASTQPTTGATEILATPESSTAPEATGWPLKDLSARPQIWFAPLDPWSWDRFEPGAGPHHFYDLFATGAAWPRVADAVQVFGLNSAWIEEFGSQAQLREVVTSLGQRGIGLWTEAGQLTETAQCNASNLEGFSGAPPARAMAERLRASGGRLYTFKLEHGFDAATIYDLACRMTPEEIARDTVHTVDAVRSVFPDVVIGSVETANLDVDLIKAWLAAYREATGEELGYLHLDVNYTIPDWAGRARAIEEAVRARGVEFGIIYVGDEADTTDASWLAHAEARFVEYEVAAGGQPDHAVFQSWHRHPEALLPETAPGTFTNLVNRYLRPRTSIRLEVVGGTARGELATSDGQPVGGASVELSARPLTGPGVVGTTTISGVVPAGATQADVGLRVNTECECSGPVELVLDGVRYREANEAGNRVPNGDFGAGLDGWGAWGSGQATHTGRGAAGALHVTAAGNQDVGLNSALLPVTPGASFVVTFTAQVSPISAGHGYFDVVFLNGEAEVHRFTADLAAAGLSLGEVATDAGGRFQQDLGQLPEGMVEITARYAGDDLRWPAAATITR